MIDSKSRHVLFIAGILALHSLAGCGKHCKDEIRLAYPTQLHEYMKSYKPGNWWVYQNTVGTRDSVFITEFREKWYSPELELRVCHSMPITELSLRTSGMDTSGTVYLTYQAGGNGESAIVVLSAFGYLGWQMSSFSYYVPEGYSGIQIVDTILGAVSYPEALRVDRRPDLVGRQLESILIARDIGIIGYITQTDTFTLSSYHIQ